MLLGELDKLQALLWVCGKVPQVMRPGIQLARVCPLVRVPKWIWKMLLAWPQECQLPLSRQQLAHTECTKLAHSECTKLAHSECTQLVQSQCSMAAELCC